MAVIRAAAADVTAASVEAGLMSPPRSGRAPGHGLADDPIALQ
jgi:hypothetical protein